MPKLVSVQQGGANALAAYLTTALAGVAAVEPRWPSPDDRFTTPKVTVLCVGKRREEYLDPRVVAQVNTSATLATYTYQAAWVRQNVQLDVWATSDIARDDVIARLDIALRAGTTPIQTAGTYLAYTDTPVGGGVCVPMLVEDGWLGGVADFLFDDVETDDAPDAVSQNEYRATIRGEASLMLTVDASSPRLATAAMKLRLRTDDLAVQGASTNPYGTASSNNAGVDAYALDPS